VTSVFHVNLVDLNGKIDFCLSFFVRVYDNDLE
jgi:hypothetical protein